MAAFDEELEIAMALSLVSNEDETVKRETENDEVLAHTEQRELEITMALSLVSNADETENDEVLAHTEQRELAAEMSEEELIFYLSSFEPFIRTF